MRSSRPFPIQGSKIDDGTGVEAGAVPRYMAEIAYGLMIKSLAGRGVADFPTLLSIEKSGGFPAMVYLDLMAGGDGQGLAFSALVTGRASKLERVLLSAAKNGA